MRIYRDVSACPDDAKGAVVALGNFDGVHLGHRAILRECVSIAEALGAKPAVMTFSPHPRAFFSPGAPPLLLQRFSQKMEAFAESGIALAFVARFNARFAALSPEDFVGKVLAGNLKARHVVTGYNFAFGKGRGGDTAFLAREAEKQGMGFTAVAPVTVGEEAVSSSAIRAHLAKGEVQAAKRLLGRPYVIEGRVIHGDKRGGELGYPTANVALGRLFRPAYGVYAVRVEVEGQRFGGVANLGIRPMFALEEPLLEVHVFDMAQSLYGRKICVELVDFLREERYFDSLDGLKAQIAADETQARMRLKEFA